MTTYAKILSQEIFSISNQPERIYRYFESSKGEPMLYYWYFKGWIPAYNITKNTENGMVVNPVRTKVSFDVHFSDIVFLHENKAEVPF